MLIFGTPTEKAPPEKLRYFKKNLASDFIEAAARRQSSKSTEQSNPGFQPHDSYDVLRKIAENVDSAPPSEKSSYYGLFNSRGRAVPDGRSDILSDDSDDESVSNKYSIGYRKILSKHQHEKRKSREKLFGKCIDTNKQNSSMGLSSTASGTDEVRYSNQDSAKEFFNKMDDESSLSIHAPPVFENYYKMKNLHLPRAKPRYLKPKAHQSEASRNLSKDPNWQSMDTFYSSKQLLFSDKNEPRDLGDVSTDEVAGEGSARFCDMWFTKRKKNFLCCKDETTSVPTKNKIGKSGSTTVLQKSFDELPSTKKGRYNAQEDLVRRLSEESFHPVNDSRCCQAEESETDIINVIVNSKVDVIPDEAEGDVERRMGHIRKIL